MAQKSIEYQIVTGAIRMLNKYGWTRHQYGDRGVGFCAMGAIYEVREALPEWFASERKVIAAIRSKAGIVDQTIESWSDQSGERVVMAVLLEVQKQFAAAPASPVVAAPVGLEKFLRRLRLVPRANKSAHDYELE